MTINQNEPELGLLRTEQVDAKFQLLDVMSISELLQAMNESDTENWIRRLQNCLGRRSGGHGCDHDWRECSGSKVSKDDFEHEENASEWCAEDS